MDLGARPLCRRLRGRGCANCQSLPQAVLFVRQRERPGLPSQAVAWPPRLSAGRRAPRVLGPEGGEVAWPSNTEEEAVAEWTRWPRRDYGQRQGGCHLPQGTTYKSICTKESDGDECFFTTQGLSLPGLASPYLGAMRLPQPAPSPPGDASLFPTTWRLWSSLRHRMLPGILVSKDKTKQT